MSLKIAVLASGGGSNLQALLDAWKAGQFGQAEIAVVGSNRPQAGALQRADASHVPTFVVDPRQHSEPRTYDQELRRKLSEYQPGLICLAGYLRILTPQTVAAYPQKIMNVHPALLPSFGGAGMYGKHVHAAVLASGAKFSGCTVHFVDEGADTGPIILQATVPVLDQDTPETLAERVLIEEHRLYPRAVALFCAGRLQVQGKRVHVIEKA